MLVGSACGLQRPGGSLCTAPSLRSQCHAGVSGPAEPCACAVLSQSECSSYKAQQSEPSEREGVRILILCLTKVSHRKMGESH